MISVLIYGDVMVVKEILNLGEMQLKDKNVPEANLNAKVLLASVLECRKEELIIKFDEEIEADKQNEYFSRNRQNESRLSIAIYYRKKRLYGNGIFGK